LAREIGTQHGDVGDDAYAVGCPRYRRPHAVRLEQKTTSGALTYIAWNSSLGLKISG
jgi:hypothetical protein